MRDERIIDLYFKRDERAVRETERSYGQYLGAIAFGVLSDSEDASEAVNDTYHKAWVTIPPHRPASLRAYLARIVRHLSIDAWRRRSSLKRAASEYALSLTELEESVPSGDDTLETVDVRALASEISRFLCGLEPRRRIVFVRRHFYLDPVRVIAWREGMSEAQVKSMLYRTRQDLKKYLEQRRYLDETDQRI